MTTTIPRPEYPRPQFVRERWANLNGEWTFEFDDGNSGLKERWQEGGERRGRIVVPYAYQAPLSGIGVRDFHDIVWYQRKFTVPADWAGDRILLHFGAVDYRATVWVNGLQVAFHEGARFRPKAASSI